MDIPFIDFVKITFSEYIALLNTIDEGSLVGKLKKQISSNFNTKRWPEK
jgi:hypothetical protein